MIKNNVLGKYNKNSIFYYLKKSKMNKLETSIYDRAKQNCSIYPQACFEFQTKKVKKYDFFIPNHNVILEVDGDIFHGTQKDVDTDVRYTKLAMQNGLSVVRVKESYIRSRKGINKENMEKLMYNISYTRRKPNYISMGEYDLMKKSMNFGLYIIESIFNRIFSIFRRN